MQPAIATMELINSLWREEAMKVAAGLDAVGFIIRSQLNTRSGQSASIWLTASSAKRGHPGFLFNILKRNRLNGSQEDAIEQSGTRWAPGSVWVRTATS